MDFIDSLVTELRIDKLPPEKQASVLRSTFSALNKRLMMRIESALTPEQRDHFVKVGQEQGPEAAFYVLIQMLPQYDEMYRDEAEALKNEMKRMLRIE